MDPRTPAFTLSLEEPLRRLAKNRLLSLQYLTRRHELNDGDLQLWLDTFNSSSAILTNDRIDKVKAEVGLITVGTASAQSAAAPHIEGPASAPPAAETFEGRGFKGVKGPAIECLRLLADNPGMAESAAAKQAGFSSWSYFKKREFGNGPIAREKMIAYLRERGVSISATPPAPAAAQPRQAPRPLVERAQPIKRAVAAEVSAVAGPPPDSAAVELHPVRVRLQLEVSVCIRSVTVEPR